MSDAEARRSIGVTKGLAIAALATGVVVFGGIGFLAQSPESLDDGRGGNGFFQNIKEKEPEPSEELIPMNETDTSIAANKTKNDQ